MLRTASRFYFELVPYVGGLYLFVPRDINGAYGGSLDHDKGDHLAFVRILHVDHYVAEKTGLVNVFEVFPDLCGIVEIALFGLCRVEDDTLIDPLVADDLDLCDPVTFRSVEEAAGDAAKNKKKSQFSHSDRKINR